MGKRLLASAAIASLLALPATPALAQDAAPLAAAQAASVDAEFARFAPRPSKNLQLDFSVWQDALRYMVLRMGPSTRLGANTVLPLTGTRFVYGHDSRIRLEGNRIPFSMLSEEAIAPLTEYREDLQRIAGEIDIASLPKNQQLAFWINLHNVAVIEKIALNYPVTSPSLIRLDGSDKPLDETKFITIAGVAMSPKDIRTKIVFPHWDDPKVIYGFFRGELGGPTIPREAYTAANVDALLAENGNEFVNSLRGVESIGGKLLVSEIFEEAAPFFFPRMDDDLKAHLATLAEEDVSALLAEGKSIKVNTYVDTVADLAGGEKEPLFYELQSNGEYASAKFTPSILRLLGERAQKYRVLQEQGRLGRVILLPNPGETIEPAEEAGEPAQPEQ